MKAFAHLLVLLCCLASAACMKQMENPEGVGIAASADEEEHADSAPPTGTTPDAEPAKVPQRLLLHLKFQGDVAAGASDKPATLARDCDRVLRVSNDGQLDGTERAAGFVIVHFVGPDADRMLELIRPIVRAATPSADSFALKRSGEAGVADVQVGL